ncbi:hypothetical protein [Nitratiruptor sp. YY09-18]|uniref:hypothetical protein n=1 Tax=Nitratiruptor sp. YY09-18 TaxID=2724901 RepID=UPI001915B194|nr:hypothetical protein [Nitratiruptor sp. YY09-18]BCD68012.1 hypothetical protein NitYY0918_C0921 [Nitratiruptor sp. YY09-18]
MPNQKQLDKYEEALIQKTKELKECQENKKISSCLQCELIIGCRLRNEYVDAVYKSMNRGKGGGFEF